MNDRGFDIADVAIASFAFLIFLELFGALLLALSQGGV